MTKPTGFSPQLLLVLALLALGALACNLSSPPPPTVPPRQPTPTPQATLGISTQVPLEALPSGVQTDAPADPGVEALLRQVDPDRLMQHVQRLYGFQTRYVNSAQNSNTYGIGAARDYIENTFEAIAAQSGGWVDVWPHTFTLNFESQQTLQTNVVCTLQGTDTGAGVVIVGAHYDSVAYDVDSTRSAPGADDNATGVAALLEIARILSQTQHRATIIFVAFSAEEVGSLSTGPIGSTRFIQEYVGYFDLDVRAVLNIDTIGNVNGPDGQVNDRQIRIFSDDDNNHPARQLSRAIHLIATTYMPDLQVVVQPAGDREGRWGDHMSFTQAGYPAIRFIEAVQDPNRQNNSLDTIEYVTPSYLARSTQVALATLAVLADGLPPPGNVTVRVASENNHTLVWEPIPDAAGYVIALRQPGAITYNQIFTVGALNSLTWSGFDPARYEAVSISTVDAQGRWGPFSEEFPINE